MNEHTPGPWHVDIGGNVGAGAPEPKLVATVARWRYGISDHDAGVLRDANARLIAAAPDLLRVCRVALEHLDWLRHGESNVTDDLRAVIAQATAEVQS